MRNTLNRLLGILSARQCKGIVVFITGSKCSGKRTLAEGLRKNFEQSVMISFGQALKDFMGKNQSAPAWRRDIAQAKKMMERGSKDLPMRLIYAAFKDALAQVSKSPVIIVVGFLKKDDQCQNASSLLKDVCPDHAILCIETVCHPGIAYARAMNRGLPTDTHEVITARHESYERNFPNVRPVLQWQMIYVQVSTEPTIKEVETSLKTGLDRVCDGIEQKKLQIKTPKTLAPGCSRRSSSMAA
jgi:adenylate kinase family enzyme